MKKLALAGFFAIQNLFTQFGGHEQELRTKFDLSIGGSRNLPKKERKPKTAIVSATVSDIAADIRTENQRSKKLWK